MSVYNGFSTRAQESKYGKLCEMLVSLLSSKILRGLKGEKSDNIYFSKQLTAIYSKMLKLESIKYLPPKLTTCCNDLAEFCINTYELSRSSSTAMSENEIPPSPRVQKALSPIASYPLEQIEEEKVKQYKKKLIFAQEKYSRPAQNNFEHSDVAPNTYYEKVMEKYSKLSNRYAPKSERSFSVGSRDTELVYKDGIFFKS